MDEMKLSLKQLQEFKNSEIYKEIQKWQKERRYSIKQALRQETKDTELFKAIGALINQEDNLEIVDNLIEEIKVKQKEKELKNEYERE